MAAKKRKRKKRKDSLVLNLLIIVVLVLVVFEGRLIVTLFTHRSAETSTAVSDGAVSSQEDETVSEDPSSPSSDSSAGSSGGSSPVTALAGLSVTAGAPQGNASETDPPAQTEDTVSDPDSSAIVREAAEPVDDSYFSDAVFIGDSRMEGFRNASGITQGQFFTSVGMNLSTMASEPIISTAEGNITVPAAVSGGTYHKIYVMLGTNDLGEYDWEDFRSRFVSAMNRLLEIQPDAILYVCSVIYVEEDKVTTQNYGDYVNNANVDTVNSILLQICEEQGYYYIDFNEILSNGYGSLIQGASEDGIHIYGKYCEQMLDYLKNHYVVSDASASREEASETEAESEAETESETEQTA